MSKFPVETIRHSAAHVMAAAVNELFPAVKFDIGPATEDGFYYDFDMERRLSPEDLEAIEERMRQIKARAAPFERLERARAEAEAVLRDAGQEYKLSRLADIPPGEAVSFYRCAGFEDLCRGPHVDTTADIGAFKLLSVAGSYFRGKEGNPMLQRVYGTAFPDEKALRAHLARLEEAKKRDHRKLGREMDLFSFSEKVGPGLVLWHPRGALVRWLIERFWRDEHYKNGYDIVYTPHVGRAELWETSGHLDFYRASMYAPMEVEGQEYYVKPMNCPFHIEIYKSRLRSYRELPLRWAELGTVYRYEKSGVLHGLPRVRGFTQDDAHIICAPSQIEDEIAEVLRFSLHIWEAFRFKEIKAYLATRPEKSVGEPARWDAAMASLEKAVAKASLACERDEGGGAFYGPKIDLKVRDAIGREWQTTTIQFDFNLPERFDMAFVAEDGTRQRPFMVHRALFGSLERFFGILVEHFAGAFPLWLAPVQAVLVPVSERHARHVLDAAAALRAAGFRVEADVRPETVGAKIKDARSLRPPYIAVAGDQEVEAGTLALRTRAGEQLGQFTVPDLAARLKAEAVPG